MYKTLDLIKEGFGYENSTILTMLINGDKVVGVYVLNTPDGIRLGVMLSNHTQLTYNKFVYNTAEEAHQAAVNLAKGFGLDLA